MALNNMARSSKKPVPADQALQFKAAQEQMKEDAARRRLEADQAPTTKKRNRPS